MQDFCHLSDFGITITELKVWSTFMPDDSFLHEAEQGKWKERPIWMKDDSTGTSVCEKDYCGLCLLMLSIKSGYPFTRHSYKDLGSCSGLCCRPV